MRIELVLKGLRELLPNALVVLPALTRVGGAELVVLFANAGNDVPGIDHHATASRNQESLSGTNKAALGIE